MQAQATTYSSRSNASAGARAKLGKDAKLGVDYDVKPHGDRFAWSPVAKQAKTKPAETRPAETRSFDSPPQRKPRAGRFDPIAGAEQAEAARPVKIARKPKGLSKVTRRAMVEQLVADGKVPPAPRFSEKTNPKYLRKLEEIQALIEDKDVKGLRALVIPPHTVKQSWHSLNLYRNNAVLALENARKAARKASN